jgi:hypothetical protein
MSAVRVALLVVGLLTIGYGVALVLEHPWPDILHIAIWAGAGVVLHDFVFAPLCVALGFAGRRIIPKRWWTPIGIASLCSVILMLLAVPVFDRPGARDDNHTVLDRNYPLGLLLSIAAVWGAALLYMIGRAYLPVRKDDVVEQQSSDHIDAQPPPVGPNG